MSLGNYSISIPNLNFQYGSISDISPDTTNINQQHVVLAACLCLALVSTKHFLDVRKRNVNVPIEGTSGGASIDYYQGAYAFLKNARQTLLEGYKKYNYGTFKVPIIERWLVVINKPELIEEIRKAPDDVFSFLEASKELIAGKWTLGPSTFNNAYHLPIVRNQLTRSLTSRLEDITDEIECSFNDLILPTEDWTSVPALRTMQKIVCRTSNRLFVGLPLCRNEDWINLNIIFTINVMSVTNKLSKYPEFLKPFIAPWITEHKRSIERATKHLRPVFEERFRMYEKYGDNWPDKPNDMITWLIEEAPESGNRDVRELTLRNLVINFAAIHTSSSSFTHALYHLAAEHEKYAAPLREEIENIFREEGWTKTSMTKMWKLDSFMKESQRLNGIGITAMSRKVMKDYTLSDGTFLPAGTTVTANLAATHRDETFYENPEVFDGFRFERMRESSVDEGLKNQMVQTSTNYLAFGHGRHACPGRFFAVNELKAMMVHILLNYDVKLEDEGVRPPNEINGLRLAPNREAKVLFRKRRANKN
ncbi:cytochrome P450 [Pyrrhoderma noxium]|uniref:Cytochrome P450 n=1 Tax=Pyrrhoderma noxium TaxID=2282107 RepID=A0A286UJB8_9AGAM|nr:cytochrome P450 [Pyrrhoderma noxium]